MSLLSLSRVSLSFGGPALLDQVSLQVEDGERICLIGRNGEGKTSLLKLLAGLQKPDEGELAFRRGTRVSYLPQEVPGDLSGSIGKHVLAAYHEVHAPSEENPWQAEVEVDTLLSQLGLEGEAKLANLSAGQKRRALLAAALVRQPDLLILDEPTNHLDIASIDWMETFLLGTSCALLFVSHDRAFLQRIATRILELDRGTLTSFDCDYPTYLRRKEELLEAEASQNKQFDKKLSKEEAWIRQGIKARRTRNEGRVRALKKLREEFRARRNRTGSAQLNLASGERSGEKVITAEDLHCSYEGRNIIRDFSIEITRGDKIGIIGPNGCGKTTLLRALLKQSEPNAGSVEHGTRLAIAYFDQLRAALDENLTVAENINPHGDTIPVHGRSRHVISYLQDFLFPPERTRCSIRVLSGGERNRLLLAKLFASPCNTLILDEPTNDLDMQTLELLEEKLLEYEGTLLLVSHDRAFINNVVTSTLVFEGEGRISQYAGGYDDWQRELERKAKPAPSSQTSSEKPARRERARKLSYKEKRELEAIPGEIEELEAEQSKLTDQLNDGDFYKEHADQVPAMQERLEAIETELQQLLERWEELEAIES